jgi:hypothetical protein
MRNYAYDRLSVVGNSFLAIEGGRFALVAKTHHSMSSATRRGRPMAVPTSIRADARARRRTHGGRT